MLFFFSWYVSVADVWIACPVWQYANSYHPLPACLQSDWPRTCRNHRFAKNKSAHRSTHSCSETHGTVFSECTSRVLPLDSVFQFGTAPCWLCRNNAPELFTVWHFRRLFASSFFFPLVASLWCKWWVALAQNLVNVVQRAKDRNWG